MEQPHDEFADNHESDRRPNQGDGVRTCKRDGNAIQAQYAKWTKELALLGEANCARADGSRTSTNCRVDALRHERPWRRKEFGDQEMAFHDFVSIKKSA